LVVGGAVIDILLGAAILHRRFAPFACRGMVAVSAVYLVAGSVLTPGIWLDPLGPFVKVLPAMVLAVVTMAVLEER
ncbi:MAG: DoxX-like family protein, partial [Burkholderiales bacterium]|nr:DoxX-like family protein [Burkholderiales bacterium]